MTSLRRRFDASPSMTVRLLALVISCCPWAAKTWAQQSVLSEPFPSPSSNAALHYNRAMLSIGTIDATERALLAKPIWEEFRGLPEDELKPKLRSLTFAARHALRAALLGCQQDTADFGIDYADYGMGAMPHVGPMLEVGRLVTLAGLQAQSLGQWQDAGMLFFYGLRVGRHMTHQPTLAETVTGVETLENNYYALANWAVRCPDRELVERAFTILDIFSEDMSSPASTLLHEARITSQRCVRLKAAFPDGPWAEMLLDSMGEYVPAKDQQELEAKAIQLCVERGIPRAAFADKQAFDAQVTQVQDLWVACFEATSASMLLPPIARAARGREIDAEFRPQLRRLGDEGMLDPANIGTLFAIHDAELTMARLVLALAASRSDVGFPPSLEAVSPRFGGRVPLSPYDNAPIGYALKNGGNDVTITIAEATAESVTFPEITFNSAAR